MMPFIGVRISWLMLARNSLFARLAISATCLAKSQLGLRFLAGGNVHSEPDHADDAAFLIHARGPKVVSTSISRPSPARPQLS